MMQFANEANEAPEGIPRHFWPHIEPKPNVEDEISEEELKRQDGRGDPPRPADPDHGKCKGGGIDLDDGTFCDCRYVTVSRNELLREAS